MDMEVNAIVVFLMFNATTIVFLASTTSGKVNHVLGFARCHVLILCNSSTDDEGECAIQYGLDPSYQDLGPPINDSLNSKFSLPFIEPNTLFYYYINATINSSNIIIQFEGNFTTGESKFDQSLWVRLNVSTVKNKNIAD